MACVIIIIAVACACVRYKASISDTLALMSGLLLVVTSIYVLRMSDHMVYGNASITDVVISFIFFIALIYVIIYSIVNPIVNTRAKSKWIISDDNDSDGGDGGDKE